MVFLQDIYEQLRFEKVSLKHPLKGCEALCLPSLNGEAISQNSCGKLKIALPIFCPGP
jgi:hypothetical protein